MRQKLPYILLLLVSVATYGQVSLDIITNKKEYTTRELIELTLILEINGSEYNQESPIKLPDFSNFYERGTGSTKNSMISPDTHTMVSQLVYQMVLQPKQAGTFKIGSALVKVNGKIYKTEPFDISISDKPEKSLAKNSSNEIFLNMEIEDREVYINEPVVAVLRAYTKDFNNLRKIKNISPPQHKNLQVYPVELNHTEIEMNGRGQMASQTLAVYTFFPEKAGRIDIAPSVIEIKSQNYTEKLKSNALQINVKQLPDKTPISFTNAVGTYNLKFKTSEKGSKFEIDKPINLIININGKGNLDENIIPKIKKSDAYQIFPPQIKQNIRNTENGLEGEITAQYVIIPKKVGKISVETSGFSFFDPQEEHYVDLGEKSLHFQITPQEEKSALEKVNEYTQNVEIPILKTSQKDKENNDNIYIISYLSDYIIGGIAFLGIIAGAFFFLRRKKETLPKTEHCHENIEDIEEKLKFQTFGNDIYICEIQTLFENKDYTQYLDVLEKRIFTIWEDRFGESLELADNENISQKYIQLKNLVRTQRFCPIHTEDDMQKIQKEVESILHEIS